MIRCHLNIFSIAHPDGNSLCTRRTDIINITGRSNRIETDTVEHIPCRHLSAIVIATQSIRCVSIETVHDGAYPFLAFPRFFQVIVKVSDMMARLISMPIGTDTSLNIMRAGNIIRQFYREKLIQPLAEQFLTSFIDISLHVLRHIPGILHGEPFCNVSPAMYRSRTLIGNRSKRGAPVSFTVASAHIFRFGINQCLIRQGTVEEITVIVFFA